MTFNIFAAGKVLNPGGISERAYGFQYPEIRRNDSSCRQTLFLKSERISKSHLFIKAPEIKPSITKIKPKWKLSDSFHWMHSGGLLLQP
jgi:hypothetical protein